MNGHETCKEWRGVKTTGNVFAYSYILCEFFFHESGSFTLLAKYLFSKIMVLTLKIVRSIFPEEYPFWKMYH